MFKILIFFSFFIFSPASFAQDSTVVHLWPQKVPGAQHEKRPSVVTDDDSGNITRLTDVTDPLMTVFKAGPAKANGKGVLIFPGGGYQILAIDLEGYEIAHWLNKQGITGFVLEYRVPQKQKGALQDAQRAIRLIRSHAKKWSIDPNKLGVMGFSAGGSLAARLSTHYDEQLYPETDAADTISARPDFALLIYPAYLAKGPNHSLTPDLKIDRETTPPMFIFQTADDPYGNSSIVMADSLRKKEVPVEFHLYPKGKHGYGLRKDNPAGKAWPPLAKAWLKKIQ